MSVPLRSCGAWAFARLPLRCSAHVARCFPSCVVTSLCDSSDDFPSTAQDSRKTLLLSCHHNSFLYTVFSIFLSFVSFFVFLCIYFFLFFSFSSLFFSFLCFSSFFFSVFFTGAENLILSGLNCFTISSKGTPLMLLFLFFSFFLSFHLFSLFVIFLFFFEIVFLLFSVFVSVYVPLLAFVSGFNKRCFLRGRCSMEMWCPDDIGRDSWDWVGPHTSE